MENYGQQTAHPAHDDKTLFPFVLVTLTARGTNAPQQPVCLATSSQTLFLTETAWPHLKNQIFKHHDHPRTSLSVSTVWKSLPRSHRLICGQPQSRVFLRRFILACNRLVDNHFTDSCPPPSICKGQEGRVLVWSYLPSRSLVCARLVCS